MHFGSVPTVVGQKYQQVSCFFCDKIKSRAHNNYHYISSLFIVIGYHCTIVVILFKLKSVV